MYLEKIAAIDAEFESLQKKRRDTLDEWVAECHPHKIGDTITVSEFRVYHYEDVLMVIRNRGVSYNWRGWFWTASGPVLEQDGIPGSNFTEWSKPAGEFKS